jgi:hypothetical protein
MCHAHCCLWHEACLELSLTSSQMYLWYPGSGFHLYFQLNISSVALLINGVKVISFLETSVFVSLFWEYHEDICF